MTVSMSCILNLKIRNGFLSSVTIKIYADRTFFAYANGLMRLALKQRFIQTTLLKRRSNNVLTFGANIALPNLPQ